MIDLETYKQIKLLQKQGHTFTYITMFLELEDHVVRAAIESKNYAEFTEKTLQVL